MAAITDWRMGMNKRWGRAHGLGRSCARSIRPAPHRRHHAATAERQLAAPWTGRYSAPMGPIVFALIAAAFTFAGFIVMLGWR